VEKKIGKKPEEAKDMKHRKKKAETLREKVMTTLGSGGAKCRFLIRKGKRPQTKKQSQREGKTLV